MFTPAKLLVAEGIKNLIPVIDAKTSNCPTKGGTYSDVSGLLGYANGINIAKAVSGSTFMYQQFALQANSVYRMSFIVHMDDNTLPVLSPNDETAGDMCIVVANNKAGINTKVEAITGNIYKISACGQTGGASGNMNVGVVKYTGQTSKTFTVSGWELNKVG
jgi:hypothetical protein